MRQAALDDSQRLASRFLSVQQAGYQVLRLARNEQDDRMALDVAEGLGVPGQKTLPCSYLYDARGSELYERITVLPEYYPTRTEASLLRQAATDIRSLTGALSLAELGSGSSAKTRVLLDAWQADQLPVTYIPIDISESMLSGAAEQLVSEYARLQVLGLAGHYEDALQVLPPDERRLYLFLGGTIGNFSESLQTVFFNRLRHAMPAGTHLLLGFDRQPHAQKPYQVIEQAYNDAQGVTAAFNLNMLRHINARLGADFDLSRWRHRAPYNRQLHRIEMHLESTVAQEVCIAALDRRYAFAAGERILTEISRKFDPQALGNWFEALGYHSVRHWSDRQGLFGLMLLRV